MSSGQDTWNQLLSGNRRRSKGDLTKLQIRADIEQRVKKLEEGVLAK